MSFPFPESVDTSSDLSQYDLTILYSDQTSSVDFPDIANAIDNARVLDPRVDSRATLIACDSVPGKRVLYVPSGDLNGDYDDVRRVFDDAKSIASEVVDLGSTKPLILVELENLAEHVEARYELAHQSFYLGLCQGLYQPLEARQALGEDSIEPVQTVGLFGLDEMAVGHLIGLEAGKRVARDLCGTEPERMAPPGFANYCSALFENTNVAISVIDDQDEMLDDYPALHAVARASLHVERHAPRVIKLEYVGEGEIEKTLYIAGKGITYDTGGVDLKVNGHMAGMSRDKGGAAAAAGLMYSLALLQPKGIRVVTHIAAVRNNVDSEAYVPDEIITGHSGVRVRVGNTDAEGRMVLMDILSHFREDAANSVNPEIYSIATLTGHAAIAHGPYTALLENLPAINANVSQRMIEAGELWGDMCHQSLVHREDFDFIKPRTKADDVLSSNNAPSVSTVRGHQFPMAFLAVASGLNHHGADSAQPIPFTHVDIAGSGVEGMDWQHGKPTGAPVTAMLNGLIYSSQRK